MRTKRHREEEILHDRVGVYFSCDAWRNSVPLYKPLIADVVENQFPGISFFFSPLLVERFGKTLLLTTGKANNTPCDRLLQQRPWKPCSVHGPFRCSCLLLKRLARSVFELEEEFMLFKETLIVVEEENKQENVPFLFIDSATRSISLFLSGLPVPQRCYGFFPMSVVDNVCSVNNAIRSAFRKPQLEKPPRLKCILCSSNTNSTCFICRCSICHACGVQCQVCEKLVCTACVVSQNYMLVDEYVCCFFCYRS